MPHSKFSDERCQRRLSGTNPGQKAHERSENETEPSAAQAARHQRVQLELLGRRLVGLDHFGRGQSESDVFGCLRRLHSRPGGRMPGGAQRGGRGSMQPGDQLR